MEAGKKRGAKLGRPPRSKALVNAESTNLLDESSHEQINEMDLSAVAISPIPDELDTKNASSNSSGISAAECRRSSRKKIIKFDVRDLLNKNRKPHKIQIEARIDSNAPAPKKAPSDQTSKAPQNIIHSATPTTTNKQKLNFLEKSAIFEKYSAAMPKKPTPPMPAALIGNQASEEIETASNAASILRAKRSSSLIVAKMESNSRTAKVSEPTVAEGNTRSIIAQRLSTDSTKSTSSAQTNAQFLRHQHHESQAPLNTSGNFILETSQSGSEVAAVSVTPAAPLRRRGRPAKIKVQTESVVLEENTNKSGASVVGDASITASNTESQIATKQNETKQQLSETSDQDTNSTLFKDNTDNQSVELEAGDSNMECIAGFDETAQDVTTNKPATAASTNVEEHENSDSLNSIKSESKSVADSQQDKTKSANAVKRRILTRRKTMHDKFLREISLTESEADEGDSSFSADTPVSTKARRAKKAKEQAEASAAAAQKLENEKQCEEQNIKEILHISTDTENVTVEITNSKNVVSVAKTEETCFKLDENVKRTIEATETTECVEKPALLQIEEHRQSPKAVLQLPPKKKLSKLLLSKANEQKAFNQTADQVFADIAVSDEKLSNQSTPAEALTSCRTVKTEGETAKVKSESPLLIKQITVKPAASPTRSDTQSPFPTRKLSRRSDRRNRDTGSAAAGKTLEETFAEIAAESTRVVLQSPIIISDEETSKTTMETENIKEEELQNMETEHVMMVEESNVEKQPTAPIIDTNTVEMIEMEQQTEFEHDLHEIQKIEEISITAALEHEAHNRDEEGNERTTNNLTDDKSASASEVLREESADVEVVELSDNESASVGNIKPELHSEIETPSGDHMKVGEIPAIANEGNEIINSDADVQKVCVDNIQVDENFQQNLETKTENSITIGNEMDKLSVSDTDLVSTPATKEIKEQEDKVATNTRCDELNQLSGVDKVVKELVTESTEKPSTSSKRRNKTKHSESDVKETNSKRKEQTSLEGTKKYTNQLENDLEQKHTKIEEAQVEQKTTKQSEAKSTKKDEQQSDSSSKKNTHRKNYKKHDKDTGSRVRESPINSKKLSEALQELEQTEATTSTKSEKQKYNRGVKKEEEIISKSTEVTPKHQKSKLKTELKNSPKSSNGKKKHKTDDETTKRAERIADKSTEEHKLSKKRKQRRLKETFEATLSSEQEEVQKPAMCENPLPASEPQNEDIIFALPPTPTPHELDSDTVSVVKSTETVAGGGVNAGATNDSPDPLKDIEKFIADGVNLLKKDYSIDEEDSVEHVIKTSEATKSNPNTVADAKPVEDDKNSDVIMELDNDENIGTDNDTTMTEPSTTADISMYLTPAATPVTTPPTTPPSTPLHVNPKSPASFDSSFDVEESTGVRRSHRIKQIVKAPKTLVGRGLVREKERCMFKDDVETKMSYSLDDHLTDLAEVEAKNVKFLKEMEERLCNFLLIKDNEYHCERVISKEARKMICECFLTPDEEERGELGCGDDCLNRLLMIECGVNCKVKERCTNKRYQKQLYAPCRVFRTEKKGFGIMADVEILPGEFIMEYIGEVINGDELRKRQLAYSKEKNRHYYFMALRGDTTIDATIKGNISRFINHSCDPNAETQKWTVNGELRIGFFSLRSIKPGEEITFNYQYERYGRAAQRCYCESANCTGWIGEEPNSDEGEQVDDGSISDDDDDVEEEEDDKLLLDLDDGSSDDDDITDMAEAQKKLEMAAAEASLTEALTPEEQHELREERKKYESSSGTDDARNKLKVLFSKLAERVAEKRKQQQKEKKTERRKRRKEPNAETQRSLEDPDVEDEVNFLVRCGLKNQADTLRLSRLMVRAKLQQTRLDLLKVLRIGELPCRRLFLDYNGLHLLHGWMSENGDNLNIRMALLETLHCLPIVNKTVLKDTKVYQTVLSWSGAVLQEINEPSPNEDSGSNDSTKPAATASSTSPSGSAESEEMENIKKLASELISNWNNLPEIFRIPKRERIEQMKEHEREADLQYAATGEDENLRTYCRDRYESDRYGRSLSSRNKIGLIPTTGSNFSTESRKRSSQLNSDESTKHLSKEQRREMFAAKVARDEEEKRAAEKRRQYETKCRFFGLDPKTTPPNLLPFYVNNNTGQWYSVERKPIATPPIYAHLQLPMKAKSTDPNDYDLPAVCDTLPPTWKYAITPQGYIYYYHIDKRKPQWEPPTKEQLEAPNSDSDSDINRDDDDKLLSMNDEQLKEFIKMKIEQRRQKRHKRLVQSRPISPRREEDRLHNQVEMRKYKENKEKIRKRKEKLRYRRIELARAQTNAMDTGSAAATASTTTDTTNEENKDNEEAIDALPIPDYLLSSDEETVKPNESADSNKELISIATTIDTSLLDKIMEGDKIVDELDAITLNRVLKRVLPPHGEVQRTDSPVTGSASNNSIPHAAINETPTSSSIAEYNEQKKRKIEKREKASSRKSKESSDSKYRRHKERFRTEIGAIIVQHLKPFYNETCARGRIQSEDDFLHLARKLTHFVMIKEQKYCESVGQKLVVTESVKNKSREFIKKYMAKYGDVYVKSENDPEYKDINVSIEL